MHRELLCEQIPSLAIAEQSTASHMSSYKLKSTLLQGPLSCPVRRRLVSLSEIATQFEAQRRDSMCGVHVMGKEPVS